ncbi:hypothetical protein JTB14_019414 [Gonioctena quinquepunctata]|nr:hypothetical protein JTB14_019414 [Gonioctena quinquepunctata]
MFLTTKVSEPFEIQLLDQRLYTASSEKAPLATENLTPLPNGTLKQPSDSKNTVDSVTQKVRTDPQKTIKVITANTSATLENSLKRNLGENGTGIRNTSITTQPPLLHNVTLENDDDDDADNSGIPKYPSEIDTEEGGKKFNETLANHNITNTKTDTNHFYNSNVIDDPSVGLFYWVDMKNRSDVKVNELLSQSHRRAATVKLSFEFPFYGHLIKNVTIATGGFLYTGDYVHSWLAATQYIAPLMANFDTSLSNDSFIKYCDNGTAFTVEWEKVQLQDKPKEGAFTFQVTLFQNGNIVFVYRDVPVLVNEIQEHHHPVKVGLSDAYIMDQTVFMVHRKTIYEYDRVHFNKTHIKSWSTIVLKALPTCLKALDCETCLSGEFTVTCNWCPPMNKCSEGFDRHRQNWMALGCVLDHSDGQPKVLAGKAISPGQEKLGVSGVLAILFLVAMVSGLSFWIIYAYRNPHTTSGQILIRYRPSQLSWKRGEARYTAATIHM